MESAIVLAPYRVKIPHQKDLFDILREKRKYFLDTGYVTSRLPVILRSRKDKEILIEVFEWTSDKHTDDAHKDPNVQEIWDRMDKICSDIGFPLEKIPEALESFPHFDTINIYN